ncbi:hypothetical protein [Limnoglobus roseus]|uniref:Uncharacterized protein n=1 Tax=Limnoglobus roseus TaxID=2598579 RepID=A0A5C1AD45_9BACT|nr:hypothetical protein [Limnoglobus roseus]QEL16565.1 hypothetical protein PX52LOC_03525 [Limnoglobus roseus]
MTIPSANRAAQKPKAKTKLRFGPADHGRPVSDKQADAAEYVGGFKYEIIDGRLYVSPVPNIPENRLEAWLLEELIVYSRGHRQIINHVTREAVWFYRKQFGQLHLNLIWLRMQTSQRRKSNRT